MEWNQNNTISHSHYITLAVVVTAAAAAAAAVICSIDGTDMFFFFFLLSYLMVYGVYWCWSVLVICSPVFSYHSRSCFTDTDQLSLFVSLFGQVLLLY